MYFCVKNGGVFWPSLLFRLLSRVAYYQEYFCCIDSNLEYLFGANSIRNIVFSPHVDGKDSTKVQSKMLKILQRIRRKF